MIARQTRWTRPSSSDMSLMKYRELGVAGLSLWELFILHYFCKLVTAASYQSQDIISLHPVLSF